MSSGAEEGQTESEVPWMEVEEYQELSRRTFWSLEELKYMAMGKIKNQDTGQAFIKIGAGKPLETNIEYVKPTYYNPKYTPKKIEKFKQKVIAANSKYYTPLESVQLEYQERQARLFGEPLKYD